MRRLAVLLVAALALPAAADEPPLPPADWSTSGDGWTLTASVDRGVTVIDVADGDDWSIPRWVRFAMPSPDGAAVLVFEGDNLLPSPDPDQIVFTLHTRDPALPAIAVPLSAVADPAGLTPTVSNWAWDRTVTWDNRGGWAITATGGVETYLDAATGTLVRR